MYKIYNANHSSSCYVHVSHVYYSLPLLQLRCTPTTLTLLICTYTCLLCCRCCGSGCLLVNTFDIRILFPQVIFLTILSPVFHKTQLHKKHNRPTRNNQPARIITYHVATTFAFIQLHYFLNLHHILPKCIFFCLLFFSFLFSP